MTYDVFYKEKEKLDKIASNIQHYKDCISTQRDYLKQTSANGNKEFHKHNISIYHKCCEFWKRTYYRQLRQLGAYAK